MGCVGGEEQSRRLSSVGNLDRECYRCDATAIRRYRHGGEPSKRQYDDRRNPTSEVCRLCFAPTITGHSCSFRELEDVTKKMSKLRHKKRWRKWLGAEDDAMEIAGFKEKIIDAMDMIKVGGVVRSCFNLSNLTDLWDLE